MTAVEGNDLCVSKVITHGCEAEKTENKRNISRCIKYGNTTKQATPTAEEVQEPRGSINKTRKASWSSEKCYVSVVYIKPLFLPNDTITPRVRCRFILERYEFCV